MSIYDTLEEFNNIIYFLTLDFNRLKPRLGSRDDTQAISRVSESNRRLYFKAIFTYLEAVVEQNKKLLFEMHKEKKIKLEPEIVDDLKEKKTFLKLKKKIQLIYMTSGNIFNHSFKNEFNNNKSWDTLKSSITIRNRITHPKNLEDCFVKNYELDLIDNGVEWFQKMHNKFVYLINSHKSKNKW